MHICVSRIGDWYPERNIFQILIAINAGTCSRPYTHSLLVCAHGTREIGCWGLLAAKSLFLMLLHRTQIRVGRTAILLA